MSFQGSYMTTILKWAGNKTAIMPELIKHLPAGSRLVEPFAGSCAVMMATDYPHYLVADINPDLISLYSVIKNGSELLITIAKGFFDKNNTAEDYYGIRKEFNCDRYWPAEWRAAMFLYLNRHCYRGLCRYNLGGHFNTPYGNYKNRISLKSKYVHSQKKPSEQRLSVPAMTKHWRCCRLVMLFTAILHTTVHLAVITLPVLLRMISIVWRLFLNAGHRKGIRLLCPIVTRL